LLLAVLIDGGVTTEDDGNRLGNSPIAGKQGYHMMMVMIM